MMYKAGYDVLEFEKLDTDELFQQYIEAVQAAALKNYDKMKVIIEGLIDKKEANNLYNT